MHRNLLPVQLFLNRGLLLVDPRDLRARFATDMLEVFKDLLSDSAVRSGFSGQLSVWATALREVLTVALPARLQNTRWAAAAVSLVIASFIAWIFFRSVS